VIFHNPVALLLLALGIPIVLLYILRLRRQPHVVPSTLLWKRALDDVQANTPWQKLRPNILLLLQLLALIALVLTLANPALTRARTFTGDLVVIVDESYGMQAHDVSPSRFSVALHDAHTLASELNPGNVMSIVGMAAQPHLAIAESQDPGAIAGAISALQITNQAPNFLSALSLASSLARNSESTRVVVYTSRDSGISDLPISVPFPVKIVRIGARLQDLGITDFRAAHLGRQTRAVLTMRNFGAQVESSDLDLFADGQLADVRPVTVSPGQDQTLFWTALPGNIQTLRATIVRRDSFDRDKTAWAVLPAKSTKHVLLVSTGNYFLETALALAQDVNLSAIRPSLYRSSMASAFDAVVFDRFLPHNLPSTPALLVAPPAGRVGSLRFGSEKPVGSLSTSSPSQTSGLGSVLQYLDFSDVHVARARTLSIPSWMQPLVTSNRSTLVAAGDSGTSRLALVDFDLQRSDWPLRVSYPVAVQNLLNYLTPGLTLGTSALSVGQHLSLFSSGATAGIDVTRPDGKVDRLRPPLAPFTDTQLPGVYRVQSRGSSTSASSRFAVNFFHPSAPHASGPAVLILGRHQSALSRSVNIPQDLGWAFGAMALCLLSFEWWLSYRR
jgi:Ca-activated chloride channel homolog